MVIETVHKEKKVIMENNILRQLSIQNACSHTAPYSPDLAPNRQIILTYPITSSTVSTATYNIYGPPCTLQPFVPQRINNLFIFIFKITLIIKKNKV